jgi:hypothetical protein
MPHISLQIGHHQYRPMTGAGNGTCTELMTSVRADAPPHGATDQHGQRPVVVALVEAADAPAAQQIAAALPILAMSAAWTDDIDRRAACAAISDLVDQLSSHPVHASVVIVLWPKCHVLSVGANRHLHIRGNATQVMTPDIDGRSRLMTTILTPDDWVMILANSTRQCLPLSHENIAIRMHGDPRSVCQALTGTSAGDDPGNDHAAIALHAVLTP